MSSYNIDITGIVRGQIDGTYDNYGVQLRPTSNRQRFNYFASSENANEEWRPKLVIDTVASQIPIPQATNPYANSFSFLEISDEHGRLEKYDPAVGMDGDGFAPMYTDAGFDPSKKTFVLVHGWNGPLSGLSAKVFDDVSPWLTQMAESIRKEHGDVNILG
jgi:hypothetical protein